jgi:hypothetical protein
VVVVPEIVKHEAPTVTCSVPVVIVPSVYVPSELAVHVPVTDSEPVTDTVEQPTPSVVTSTVPPRARHEDITLHVPTTLPPQAVTFEQAPPPPPPDPPAELPPVPTVPPLELPPAPDWPELVLEQAKPKIESAAAIARSEVPCVMTILLGRSDRFSWIASGPGELS